MKLTLGQKTISPNQNEQSDLLLIVLHLTLLEGDVCVCVGVCVHACMCACVHAHVCVCMYGGVAGMKLNKLTNRKGRNDRAAGSR